MTTSSADQKVASSPLIEDLDAFFRAQSLDTTITRTSFPYLHLITTDDDDALVVNFIALDQVVVPLEPDITDEIARLAQPDPIRTRLILSAEYTPSAAATVALGLREVVHDVVRYSDFLDRHIRPDKVCGNLLRGGRDELNSESGLLYEGDFVEPYARTPTNDTVPALRYLHQGWANGLGRRVSIVLAPAGLGKSKLTHILAKRIARTYVNTTDSQKPPIPFLIPFGKFRTGTQDFTGLIHSRLNEDGIPKLRVDAFQFLVTSGRVLFMLDGFDEMMEADPATARTNLSHFVENVGQDGRILLTSRTLFYHAVKDVLGSLGDPDLG